MTHSPFLAVPGVFVNQCLSCQGVVPAGLVACPNCAVTRKKKGLTMAAVGLVALAVSNCGSAMALYGVPCTAQNGCLPDCTTKLPDGGDPKKDPTNTRCFTDGGTP